MAYQSHSLQGYNSSSSWQLSSMLKHVNKTLDNLKLVSSLTEDRIKIVDYGCSEGQNSAIFFNELFKKYRETSDKPIEILHNDLPQNNWSVFFNIMNDENYDYSSLNNIYYSALGKSFFEDIAAPNSVHLSFTAHAFHYMSKRPIRKQGDYVFSHPNYIEQGKKDFEILIRNRIKELVPGGIFSGLLVGRVSEDCFHIYEAIFEVYKKLKELGYITQDELDTFGFSSFPIYQGEIIEVLLMFSDKIDMLAIDHDKAAIPSYQVFLEDNDTEKYANSIVEFFTPIAKPNLLINFPGRNLIEIYREEMKKVVLADPKEYYFDTFYVSFKKK